MPITIEISDSDCVERCCPKPTEFCNCNYTTATLDISGRLNTPPATDCECLDEFGALVGLGETRCTWGNINGRYVTSDLRIEGATLAAYFHLGTQGDIDDPGILVSSYICPAFGAPSSHTYVHLIKVVFQCTICFAPDGLILDWTYAREVQYYGQIVTEPDSGPRTIGVSFHLGTVIPPLGVSPCGQCEVAERFEEPDFAEACGNPVFCDTLPDPIPTTVVHEVGLV